MMDGLDLWYEEAIGYMLVACISIFAISNLLDLLVCSNGFRFLLGFLKNFQKKKKQCHQNTKGGK